MVILEEIHSSTQEKIQSISRKVPARSSSKPSSPPSTPKNDPLDEWEKWCAVFVTIGHSMLTLPIEFDWKIHRFRVTRFRVIFWLFILRLSLMTIDNLYLLSASRHVKPGEVSNKEFMDFYVHTLTRCIANFTALALAADFESTTQLLNTLLVSRKSWKATFGSWTENFSGPSSRRLNKISKAVAIFLPLQSLIPCFMYFNSRMSWRYWPAHFFSQEMYNSLPLIVGTAINDLHLGTIAVICSGYVGYVIICTFVILRFWVETLTCKVSTAKSRSSSSFLPLMQYRALLLLNRTMTACIGGHIIPCAVAGAFWANVGVLTMTITSFHIVSVPVKLNLIASSALLMSALKEVLVSGGTLLSKSVLLKGLLQVNHSNPLGRRYLKSCREMRMYVGSFFYTKAGSYLTCAKLLLDQTITALFSI